MTINKDQKVKLECLLCGKIMIQGYSYKRKFNQHCNKCRKLIKKKY